ncbi:STAS domain-containing protein [Oceanobacillus bengalensis]|uniref:STAS domain-containing protein n=2 Tax=Oceanobacillus bengalensis TaxID=1435466 RepID=A0A494Z4E5_9BACI|nr:STAS domain-containing protein [Oceanobacillus bengalensis]
MDNRAIFEEQLLKEADTVREKIEEIKLLGNINLLENAHKLIIYSINGQEEDVIVFGKKEGIAWAEHKLTLKFKIEWVQAIRKTLLHFIEEYDKLNDKPYNNDLFTLLKQINVLIDKFFKGFFLSYSGYKDALLESQTKLVENLSVPIIPISTSISILPLIGAMDDLRISTIEEKVLLAIKEKRIQTLIIDLSGISSLNFEEIQQFMKMMDGIRMMGCQIIITGIRPEVVKNVVTTGLSFGREMEVRATLEKALKDYLKNDTVLEESSIPTT